MTMLDLWREPRRSQQNMLDRWDTFSDEFDRMFAEMENMLAPWRDQSRGRGEERNMMRVPCDIQETKNNYLLSFDLPGVSKEDVNIEMVGNQLVVTGERKQQREDKEGSYYRAAKHYGQFQRRFTLPVGIKAENIEAQYENGVLHIAIPKAEPSSSKKINITEGKEGFFKKLISKDKEDKEKTSSQSQIAS